MKYFRKLIGEKCYLSPLSIEDAERYTEWLNDMEVGQFILAAAQIIDVDKEREILKHLMQNNIIFAIVDKDTNKAIGICGLHDVSNVHRRATLGIFIGDKAYWNQGYGTESTALLADYGFNIMNLNSITLEVVEYNKRAISCYEKIGFKLAGKHRDYMFMSGKYHNVLIYDILPAEFTSPFIIKTFERSTSDDAGRSKITIE
jgi:RimJ/RimL family protein N-acetyltransferase